MWAMDFPIRLNLSSTDWRSSPVPVGGSTRFTIDAAPAVWGAAVVEVQWSLTVDLPDPVDQVDLTNWRSFPTKVELKAATPYAINQYAPTGGYLSVICTTADGTASSDAPAVLKVQP